MSAAPERAEEPAYELTEGGSTLRVYTHIGATLDDLLAIEINGPADSVRLSWNDALELSDALRDLIGRGTFKEDALRAAEKRGAVKALRAEVEYFVGASTSAVLDESTRRTAQGAAAHLRSMADRIESGDVAP